MRPSTTISRSALLRSVTVLTLISSPFSGVSPALAQVQPSAEDSASPDSATPDPAAPDSPGDAPDSPTPNSSGESPDEAEELADETSAQPTAPTEAEPPEEREPSADETPPQPPAPAESTVQGTDEPFDELSDEGFFDDEEELEFGAVAEVEAPPREPTKRTLEKEQLTRIPGTRGDALRAIEIMPGVARTAYGENDGPPLLRGSSSQDSLVLLDGAPVPLLYHFGGLTSFYNSQLLESVDLYPGNYSARYGRASAGVVEARVRDPKEDKFHAMLELSAVDSFALVESPLGRKTSMALAVRRSNIDLFFDAFVPDDAYSVLSAPVYWDYQAVFSHRFNENHQLRVLGYGSHDRLELYFDDAVADEPALRGAVDGRSQFHRAQIEMNSRFSDVVTQQVMVSVGPSIASQVLGELEAEFNFFDINARAEWSIFAHDTLRIDAGLDFQMFAGTGEYYGPAPVAEEGNPLNDPLSGEEFIRIDQETVYPVRPAAYLEASWRPFEEWLLVPGVRVDYTGDGNDWTVDPRFSTRLSVLEGTTLKGGVGLYSQPPEYFEIMEDLGNPDATPFRTLQTSLGMEQRIIEGVTLDVEGFYKHWYDRLIGTEGGAPPRFLNDGTGRAYGLEVLLEARPTKRTQAFASYTLSRSERKDGDGASYRLFDYDQTHNLSLTANYDLGKGWIVGARFRYVTGNPTTPIVGSVYDASTDTYRALNGAVNSDRLQAFHQLDVRGEKRWDIGPVGLTVYLEILNAYNRKNAEGIFYSFDYSEQEIAQGLPIFPNLGIRGEL